MPEVWEAQYQALRAALTARSEFSIEDNSPADLYLKDLVSYLYTPKSKYDAEVDPTVADDGSDGFVIGSFWHNKTDKRSYVCLNPAEGAAEWLNITVSGGAGETFVDRGDPSSPDWTVGDLTLDATWRDLSLSSVIPEGAYGRPVLLKVSTKASTVGSILSFRKNGASYTLNALTHKILVSNVDHYWGGWVVCDSSGVIEYYGTPGMVTATIIVRGWMVSA